MSIDYSLLNYYPYLLAYKGNDEEVAEETDELSINKGL